MDNQKVEFGFDTIAMEDDAGASLSELQSHYKVDGVEVWKNYVELYKFNEGESFGNYSVSMLEIPIDAAGKPLPTDIYNEPCSVQPSAFMVSVSGSRISLVVLCGNVMVYGGQRFRQIIHG